MKRGDKYNWKHDKETKLVYMGVEERWHQFAKVETPDVIWCEVRDNDLFMMEETKDET